MTEPLIESGRRPFLVPSGLPATAGEDAQPALQSWLAHAQATRRPLWLPPQRTFRLDSPLVIQHGQANASDLRHQLDLCGNNCVLMPNFPGPALVIAPRCPRGQAGSGRGEAQIQIRDLHFHGVQNPNSRAIQWGAAGFQCSSLHYSLLENVLLAGFNTPGALRIESARHIEMRRVVCRHGAGVEFLNLHDGDACGDVYAVNCEFNGSASVRPLDIRARGQAQRVSCGGLHFDHCVIYGTGTRAQALRTGRVGDIHFDCCAWDGPTAGEREHAIELNAAHPNSEVIGIELIGPRITGNYSGNAFRMIGAGSYWNIQWRGGEVRRVRASPSLHPSAVVVLANCESVDIEGPKFWQCEATSLINVFGSGGPCRNWSIKDVRSQEGAITNLVYVSSHAHDGYQIIGNRGHCANVVRDRATGSPQRVVRQNLRLPT